MSTITTTLAPPAPRHDLFTMVHKGARALLFELATETARLDVASDEAVAQLVARVGRTLALLDDHAAHEDAHVLPALRAVAPEIATALAQDHDVLHAIQAELASAAEALRVAPPAQRAPIALVLLRLGNRLTAAHLSHMGREETEANHALWRGYTDGELGALHGRLIADIPPAQYAAWMEVVLPALSPPERALLASP